MWLPATILSAYLFCHVGAGQRQSYLRRCVYAGAVLHCCLARPRQSALVALLVLVVLGLLQAEHEPVSEPGMVIE